ncbi:MAG: GGDEF domain-containing protein [Xanthobacteraceae bacterium]
MKVRSWKDAVRAVIAITLLSMLASVLIAGLIAMLLGKRLDPVFALSVPAIFVPFFAVPLVRANLRLSRTRSELERLVRTDSLTGLPNRRSFLEEAGNFFSSPAADEDGIAVMMVDIDHFKRINDSCGHDIGDRVLKMVANAIVAVALRERPRQVLIGRIGGEEFAVLARAVDRDRAVALAERFCQAVRRLHWSKCEQVTMPTVSIGIAMRDAGETFAQVLKAADIAVYDAKALGRDRWCIARQDGDEASQHGAPVTQRRRGEGVASLRKAAMPAEAGTVALREAQSA